MSPYQGEQYTRGDLSVTERVMDEIATLPMYPQMSSEDLRYLIDSIQETIRELS